MRFHRGDFAAHHGRPPQRARLARLPLLVAGSFDDFGRRSGLDRLQLPVIVLDFLSGEVDCNDVWFKGGQQCLALFHLET